MADVERLLHDTGEISSDCPLDENGEKHGVAKVYRRDGRIFAAVEYKHGTLDGITRYFYKDGSLELEMHICNGENIKQREFEEGEYFLDKTTTKSGETTTEWFQRMMRV